MKTGVARSTILFTLMIFLSSITPYAQEIDPFYLNLLKKGEQSFLSGDFKDAIKDLEVAYFGIHSNKKIKAKVCVYLSLSYFYSINSDQGRKYLSETEALLGEDGFHSLDIEEDVLYDFIQLSSAFKRGMTVRPEGLKALPKVPKERISQSESAREDHLKRRIEETPRNVSLYYELYALFRLENNPKEAKKTIEKLVEKNPQEVFGYYILGIIQYKEGKFKDASSSFEDFFQLSKNLAIRPVLKAESRAFQILSLYNRGEKEAAEKLIFESAEALEIENTRIHHFSEKDKIVLNSLLKEKKVI
jgi:tetratricopeptide (TPR) repeat protein